MSKNTRIKDSKHLQLGDEELIPGIPTKASALSMELAAGAIPATSVNFGQHHTHNLTMQRSRASQHSTESCTFTNDPRSKTSGRT